MTTPSETWAPPPDFRQRLLDEYGLTCPPRWGLPRRPHYATYGPAVAKVMTALGTPPMPHQRYLLDCGLEVDPVTGLLAYRENGLSIPRQQGKTQTQLGVMIHRVAAWPRQRVTYAAQTRQMARMRWEDEFVVALEAAKPLAGRFNVRKGNGNEAIIWKATRSLLGITSNTEKAGHGPPLDLGFIDEAFAHEDDRLEQAMAPAMLTRANAQLWWASAGGTEKSVFLNRKRANGRELVERFFKTGEWPTSFYAEWFSPDDEPRDDPATWFGCMPALCPAAPCTCDPAGVWHHTITEATVKAELGRLEAAEFDRAMLNRTKRSSPPPDPNVPAKEWPGRVDVTSRCGTDMAFAIDVTPGRDRAAIAVYSVREDGMGHAELVDHRPGTDWLVDALARLRRIWDPVAIAVDAFGPAGSVLDALDKAGIRRPKDLDNPERGDLIVANTRDVVTACAQLADAVRQDKLVHIDQAQLNSAIAGARTRSLGDAWAWARRATTSDISPLVAVTLARWAYEARCGAGVSDYDVADSVL
jgi:hypothetical protein